MSRFLFSAFLVALSLSPPSATANPLPTAAPELDYTSLQNATRLLERGGCANPCGWSSWLCCGPYATCYTNALTQAACASIDPQAATPVAGGYWSFSTTTYCVTSTFYTTAVWSTYIAPAVVTPKRQCAMPLVKGPR